MLRNFTINVIIGLALLLVLHSPWVQRNRALADAREAIVTWQMATLTGVDTGQRLAWIDIDEAAHAAWGLPSSTRRDKLATLIAFALRGRPSAIVVDIDLTSAVPGLPQFDAQLRRELQNHVRSCAAACTPVFLVRSFAPSPDYVYAGREGAALQARPSFLDPALSTSPLRPWSGRGVYWGSAGMDREADLVVRRWRLWESSCSVSGPAIVIPSVALLAAAAAAGTNTNDVRGALQRHALFCARAGQTAPVQMPQPATYLRIGKSQTALTENALDRRLFFRIPWSQSDRAPGLAVTLPAGPIAGNPHADPSILRGRVVVIGTSNHASGDMRMTPIGEMPGALVIVNAVNSLLRGDQIHEPGWAVSIGIELVLILIVSFLFAMLSTAVALALSLGIIVLGSLTLGFVAFNSGVWIDSVVPLAGVILHEVLDRLHHRFFY